MLRRLLYHNFRFIHRISQWGRRRFTSAGMMMLGFLVVTAVFSVDTRQSLAFQLAALVFSLLLFAVIASLGFRPRLEARRSLPEFATVDEPVSYEVTVNNSRQRKETGLLMADSLDNYSPTFRQFMDYRDDEIEKRNLFDRAVGYPRWLKLVRRLRGADIQPQPLPELPPLQAKPVRLTIVPLRRGYLHFTQMTFLRPDPFGLVNARYSVPGKQTLLVLPKRYPVAEPRLPGKRRYQPGGVDMASSVSDSQEFKSLRDYRPGDPLRHIHWRSWARTGKPVVREFQDEYYVRQALLLDTFLNDGHSDIFEEAVSVAASFVCDTPGRDALLDLMFIGPSAHSFVSGRGTSTTAGMLEILACVEPCRDKPFSTLQQLVMDHKSQLSGFICVLLGWDEQRRELVKELKSLDLPVKVMVITRPGSHEPLDAGPMCDDANNFLRLEAGRIGEILRGDV